MAFPGLQTRGTELLPVHFGHITRLGEWGRWQEVGVHVLRASCRSLVALGFASGLV